MKLRLLPSTIEPDGSASLRQHHSCFIVDGTIAFDAGSLAISANHEERSNVRDVVLSHADLDHIAGLPLFIDDLFPVLEEPIRVHAVPSVIEALEENIFNWTIYPRFSELRNHIGAAVIEYRPFENDTAFQIGNISIVPVEVNHNVPSSGFVISDGASTIAISGDTAETAVFWETINSLDSLNAILIECAFPNEHEELAARSFHMTPRMLARELEQFGHSEASIYVINLKPAYYDSIVAELGELGIDGLHVLEPARIYEF